MADFQALVEPEVHGVLQAAEFGAVWRSRMETLAKTPMIMCDLPKVPLRDKKVSWETLLTGKVVISEEGRLTIATTTKFRNQAGQVVREKEQVLPRATLWVGGLRAFLQHAIRLSFFKREVSEANFKRFALAFQTIYDTAAKRAHNSTRCVIHYATGNSEEEGATLKLTHGETAFQKFRAVTGLEPSRVLAPAGRGPADRGYPRQNQREAEDDNRWYWHEDRRAAPKRPWQPWQSDRWNP